MLISGNWTWDKTDFLAMGILIGAGTLAYEVGSRIFVRNRLVVAGIAILIVLYLWVELAVGLFTNWGS